VVIHLAVDSAVSSLAGERSADSNPPGSRLIRCPFKDMVSRRRSTCPARGQRAIGGPGGRQHSAAAPRSRWWESARSAETGRGPVADTMGLRHGPARGNVAADAKCGRHKPSARSSPRIAVASSERNGTSPCLTFRRGVFFG
jgi:hypothetical protein